MANKAPVISPAELAALIGRSGQKDFAAAPVRRALHGVDSADFEPEDITRRAVAIPLPEESDDLIFDAQAAAVAAQPAPVAEDPPPPDLEAIRAAAFAEGHAAGFAKGQTAAMADSAAQATATAAQELAEAAAQIRAAMQALTAAGDHAQQMIARDLEQAVLRLASDRAGIAIDANPAPFFARVTRLAERIAQGLRHVQVALHPDDLEAIRKHLGDVDLPMTADSALLRGDVAVRAQGLLLADMLLASGDAP